MRLGLSILKADCCVSWIKSEPFFGKIPTLTFNCPPPAAGKIRGPASQDRQAKIPWGLVLLKPLSFLPASFGEPRKISAQSTEKIKMGYLLYPPRCLPRLLFFYFLLLLFFHLQIPMLGWIALTIQLIPVNHHACRR